MPFLSAEEERSLARKAAAGDVAAAHRLILSHLRVVVNVARFYGRYGLPLNELIQEGTVGLIQAVRKFNPDRDARLATYAMWWVRAAIQDHVVRSWSVVRVGKTAAHRALFFNLKRQAALRSGGTESLGEDVLGTLARRFGLPLPEVAAMARRVAGFDQSLDVAPAAGNAPGAAPGADPTPLVERLPDEGPSPEDIAAESGLIRLWSTMIERALAALPAREALIIRDRYLSDAARTFEAIGRDLGVSKDRVRQLEGRALKRLRELLGPLAAANELPA